MPLKQCCLAIAAFILFPSMVHGQVSTPAPVPKPGLTAGTTLLEPANGSSITSFGPILGWLNPAGMTQYHLQVIPFANDGPGVDIIGSGSDGTFRIPAPPEWYGLLPDMTYTWRVRTAVAALGAEPAWGAWSERRFRTPAAGSGSISLPATVPSATPVLRWANSRSDIFYYEVQLSQDRTFNTDPRTATASIYSAIIHGGVTDNSYQVPDNQPLQGGTAYYWRVRPRVQGDGHPVAWSDIATFTTPAAQVTVSAPVAAPPATGSQEQQSLGLINQIRNQHGLTTLGQAGELAEAARWHSADMASRGSMSHYGSDGSGPAERITAAGYNWRIYGEIVAAGYQSPEEVVNAWMNSPSHKEVILLPDLREFGAGLAYGVGRPYWTVDFGVR